MIVDWLMVLLGVVLTAGTFVFVASEFSLVALDPTAVDRRVAAGDRRAAGVSKALRQLSTQLSGAQVGITLTTILLGYTAQSAISNLLTAALPSALAESAATAIAVAGSLVLVNTFSMVFGELIPKNWAISEPMQVAGLITPVQRGFTLALRPMIQGLNSSANWVLRKFGIEPREELSGARSAPELAALVRHSAAVGTLDVGTAALLTRSIGLGSLTAVDVMTDRMRLATLESSDTAADVIARARETGHSRFPVIEDSPDEVVGLVHLRRAVAVPFERRDSVPVGALMDDAPRVPETIRLAPLLLELREFGHQMAVVVDEYGGTSGAVTLEDVVEELVGDVADEHDPRRRPVRSGGERTWVVAGTLRPDELHHETGLRVPDEAPYETLGGLVMTMLGRLPQVADEVEVPGVRLRVERMDGRRVDSIRVTAVDVEPEVER
ncbi:hemolysin family protein [Pseudactinotalea suaedae]|uniref:hemolysin family protein n=1 Tax=Pseudactinotalea suaedae TaxID=1524924 RepID=UPI0019D64C83|nr:hemolysin family protein [Pseudactinotalea suaedae]